MKRAEVIKESFSIAPNRVTDAMIQALEVTPPPSPLTHSNSNPTVPLASSNSQPNLPKERRPKLQKPPTSNSTSELRRIENNVDSNQIRDEVYDPNPPIGRITFFNLINNYYYFIYFNNLKIKRTRANSKRNKIVDWTSKVIINS